MIIVRRTFWAFLILLVFGISGVYFTQATIYYRLVYFCLFVIGGSFIWTFFSIRGFTIKRHARILRQQVGQTFIEQFEISNQYPILRLWVEIRDMCPMPGKSGSRVFSWIGSRQKRVYDCYSNLRVRGFFPLGPTEVISGDPLGLFISRCQFPVLQSLVVLPHIEQINQFLVPPGALSGGRITGRRSFEVSPQAVSVREYAPGDPLNHIHWLTTARKDRLMVKEFEQDPSADIWLFLDAHHSMHSRLPEPLVVFTGEESLWRFEKEAKIRLSPDSFEYAVSSAGSVVNFFIRQGKAVGMVCAGQMMTVVTAERGERQQNRILETLALIKDEGNVPLPVLVEAQAVNLPRASTVVIITTSNHNVVEVAVNALLLRRLKPVVILIDALSFGGQKSPEGMLASLERHGTPVVSISNKMDIRDRLEHGFLSQRVVNFRL